MRSALLDAGVHQTRFANYADSPFLPLDSFPHVSEPGSGPDSGHRWLCRQLRSGEGWLSWKEVMARALYDPEWGYYAGGPRRLGRAGDFYTAVSVGPLYGQLIADHAAARWLALGSPKRYVLAEQAAHDGQLMADMLTAVRTDHPDLAAVLEVVIVEPQRAYQEAQRQRLAASWSGPVQWVGEVGDLKAEAGLLVCNELLDAFPVHRVRREAGRWMELGVVLAEEGSHHLVWAARQPRDEALLAELSFLPADLPDGYTREIQVAVVEWIRQLGRSGFGGDVWIADYGLDTDEYWSPARSEGTLRRYFGHRMDDRVLDDLGQADLTCHVHFGRLIQEAEAAGYDVAGYADQGMFLTRLAAPWLLRLESQGLARDSKALLRQFQSLTHPGIMGRSFRVLLLQPRAA
jgi:SAM-dependent MidA family methyltransferase